MAFRRLANAVPVLVALLAAVPAAAGSRPEPPVIHETFTPLPCSAHPVTTAALEGCAEQAVLKTDRVVDARARAVFGLLAPSAPSAFVRSEGWWLRYRNGSCSAQSSRYAGGTLQPVAYASCLAARNRTHTRDLAALARSLRGP